MDRIVHQAPMRRALAALVALQLVVGVIAALGVSPPRADADADAVGVGPLEPATPSGPEPGPIASVPPGETDAADAAAATVPLFEAANAPTPFKTLTNPTWEGVPLVLHVLEDRGPWLKVRTNIRPNGHTAWVRSADVKLRRNPNRILIEIGARRLTVLHGNDVLAQHRVAVGSARTPTPLGEFYVDATVNIANDRGTYGAGQLSVSGFSDVLQTFDGGIGQIAIHGWNNPSAMGQAVSNGCIRMNNDAWRQVASLASNGTPVSIRA